MIESFNDRYQQMFLGKVTMASEDDLKTGSMAFEQRHNSRYRDSKLGDTPLKALAASNAKLRVPTADNAPRQQIQKPEIVRYHVVRLIRSDLKLNIFGECFSVPPEMNLKYVVATIDVKEQKLKLFLEKKQVSVHDVVALNS